MTGPNVVSVFFWGYLLTAFVGIPLIYFHLSNYSLIAYIDTSLFLDVLVWAGASLMLVALGVIFFLLLFGSQVTNPKAGNSPNELKRSVLIRIYSCLFLLLLPSLYFVWWSNEQHPLALLNFITTTAHDNLVITRLRNAYIYQPDALQKHFIFIKELLMFFGSILFANALATKKTGHWVGAVLTVVFATALFYLEMEKTRVFLEFGTLFLVFALGKVDSSTNKRISTVSVYVGGVALSLLVSGVTFYLVNLSDYSFIDSIISSLDRMLAGQVAASSFYFQMFPDLHGFLWGRSFPNPGGILPFENFQLTVEVRNTVAPVIVENTYVGSMPAAFWTELYANFGYLGFMVVPFVGFYLGFIYRFQQRLTLDPIDIAFSAWLSVHFLLLCLTGISFLLFDLNLVLIYLFYKWLRNS